MARSRDLVRRLTAQHVASQGRILEVVAARLAAQLAQLPDLSDESSTLYVASAVPVIVAGQRRAAAVAAGFARAIAPKREDGRPLELAAVPVVTAETAWVASPIIVGRRELGAGASWGAAIALAASKAKGYTAGDLAVAQRYGIEQGAHSTGSTVHGFAKSPAGNACPWCVVVSDTVYRDASSVPFHENDACSVEPVFD